MLLVNILVRKFHVLHNLTYVGSWNNVSPQGVKAVTAKSFERIHRSNLVGMGVIPLCFKSGEDMDSIGLTGQEQYTIHLPSSVHEMQPGQDIVITTSTRKSFTCTLRFDTEVSGAFTYYSFCLPESCRIRHRYDL